MVMTLPIIHKANRYKQGCDYVFKYSRKLYPGVVCNQSIYCIFTSTVMFTSIVTKFFNINILILLQYTKSYKNHYINNLLQ